MKKYYKCPHCDGTNEVTVDSEGWIERFNDSFQENLPMNLLKATVVTVAATATRAQRGIGGLVTGVFFAAQGAYEYLNGTAVECGSCGRTFKI